MKSYKKKIGKLGEEYAEKFLKQQGYSIQTKNYRYRYGEIDIIAKKNETLIFFEVKTRTSKAYGAPQESIDQSKSEHIYNAALHYLQKHFKWENFDWRIDVIEIFIGKKKYYLRHIKNII